MPEQLQDLFDHLPDVFTAYSLKLIIAILALILGRWLASWISRLLGRALKFRDVDKAVSSFFQQLLYYAILIVVVIAVLAEMGIQTASFIALLGAAGLAISLALQGSLSNFAAGFLIIFLRPFRSGDYIEAAGTAGIVQEISLFSTKLITPDNKTITVPNGGILNNNIVNYSLQPERRIDIEVSVHTRSDLDLVKRELLAVVEADERVLKTRPIVIGVMSFDNVALNLVVRPWVHTSDFWPVRFHLMETIKKRFDELGIQIPASKLDIHVQPTAELLTHLSAAQPTNTLPNK